MKRESFGESFNERSALKQQAEISPDSEILSCNWGFDFGRLLLNCYYHGVVPRRTSELARSAAPLAAPVARDAPAGGWFGHHRARVPARRGQSRNPTGP